MFVPQVADAQFARTRVVAACGGLKRLLRGLKDPDRSVTADIHAIRKLCKSLRGGFTLFQLEKSSGLEIQAIGRLLSGPRDAVSRLNTWNKLAWNEDPRVAAVITGLLKHQTHVAGRRPPAKTIAWCVDHVAAARLELDALPVDQLAGHLAGGLEILEHRTFRRCHQLDHRAAKNFHKARKALKAWLGAVGFLPDGAISQNPELAQLAELLGDENDLATLSAWLKNHGFTGKFAPGLRTTLKTARHQLQQEAIRDAAGLLPRIPN